MDVRTLIFVLILLTLQNMTILCTDQYTENRSYHKTSLELTEVPTDIPVDAVEVYLGFNRITAIEANAFLWLSQCRELFLSSNRINRLEPGAFNGLAKLSRLYIRNNSLETLHAETFQGLVAAEYLRLDQNNIHSIEDNAFAELKKLEILYLTNNDLETIRPGTFLGLESLKELYLNLNYLKKLPADGFSHLPRPLRLKVSSNPLHCDVELCWLIEEEKNVNIRIDIVNIYCTTGNNKHRKWTCEKPIDDRKFFIPLGITASIILFVACICSIKRVRRAIFRCICPKKGASSQKQNQTNGLTAVESEQVPSHNLQVSFTDGAVSIAREEHHEYTHLQRQPEGYQQLQVPVTENESVAGYMVPQNEYEYVPDYPEYLQPDNQRFTAQARATEMGNQSVYTLPHSM